MSQQFQFITLNLPNDFSARSDLSRRVQHVLNKNSIAFRRVIDQDMGDGADEFSVLDDRATAHE